MNVFDGAFISPALWSGCAILKHAYFLPPTYASTFYPFVNIPFTIEISTSFGSKSMLLVLSKNG